MTAPWAPPPTVPQDTQTLRPDPKGQGPEIGAALVRQRWEAGTRALRKEHRDYWCNRSFLAGEQWITWNDFLRRPEAVPPPGGERLRVMADRLLPSSRTIIAKLLRRALVFEVPPTAADDVSVQGARLGAAALRHAHREQDWESLREDVAWSIWIGGTGLACVEWDAAAGQDLGQTPSGKAVGTGDVVVTALSVTEAVTEPGARNIEKARWWIKASALPPEDVQHRYNLAEAPPADASAGMSPLQHQLTHGDSQTAVPLTLVLTYFERPNPSRPKGAVAVVVGNRVVDGPHAWPFPFTDRLNVAAMQETPVAGRWTGDTILSRARSLQVALNQAVTSIVEHMRLAGNARLMVPDVSVDSIEDMSDTPGEMVPYTTASGVPAPDYLSPPAMPAWWQEQPNQIARMIDDILGVHDISRGDAPPGVESGVALSLLAEADDTPLGRLAKEMAMGFGRIGSMVLACYEAKVTETRSATLTDAGLDPELVQWTGGKLAGQTTAIVPQEAVAPRSRGAQFELARQLKTIYPDLPLQVFLRMTDLPGSEDLTEGTNPDLAKAKRSLHRLATGRAVIPRDFDQHTTVISEANRFRKSARYESMSPDEQRLIDDFIDAHEQLSAEEMIRQQQLGQVNPILPTVAQAHEPPLAGDPAAAAPQQQDPSRQAGPAEELPEMPA